MWHTEFQRACCQPRENQRNMLLAARVKDINISLFIDRRALPCNIYSKARWGLVEIILKIQTTRTRQIHKSWIPKPHNKIHHFRRVWRALDIFTTTKHTNWAEQLLKMLTWELCIKVSRKHRSPVEARVHCYDDVPRNVVASKYKLSCFHRMCRNYIHEWGGIHV